LAQFAYTQAYDRDSSVHTARVLAYQTFETKDYSTSLKMWKRVLQSDRYTSADQMAAAYTAVSSDELKLAAQWLDAYADKGGFQSDEYWWLKTVTEQKNKPQQALIDIKRAIALKPKVEYFEMLAALQTKLGKEPEAIEALQKALALNTENSSVQASLGYAYYHQKKMVEAKTYLDQALKMRPNDNRLVEQLAFVNQRLGRNEEALVYTERAIDQDDLYTRQEITPEIENQRFGLRRMHEDLSRRWSFSADAISGNQLAAVPNAPQPGLNYKSYAQAEVAYRLGNPAIDDGKTLSAYSRIFAGNGPSGSSIPMYAPVLAAGLRWKPFSSQVINFAVEQQVPLDQGQSPSANTLLRASASFFNSGKYSDEWHPAAQGWLAQNLYLDAAYYVVNRLSSLTADYRLSYHNKVGESQTLEPYSHIQWNSLNQQPQADIRAGFGVRWNIWSNESHYNAYATKISVGLEFQYAISSYLSDKSTALLTLGGRW
jgi:adsorption protein A